MKVSQCVEAYLEHKHACGFTCDSARRTIRRFARIFGSLDISTITDDHFDDFLSQAPSNRAWRSYYGDLRRFFAFWFARRQVRRVPEPRLKRRAPRTFYPYVFSRRDIRRLLDATAACQRERACIVTPETLRTVILFLYGTGIRPPDALALLDTDLDFTKGTIRVGRSSGSKSRVIPIGRDVKRLLKQHLHSDERSRFGRGRPLFLTKKGGPLIYSTIRKAFRRLRRRANVQRTDGAYQPRLFDLRHTFAVHSIMHWNRKGIKGDKVVPLLAAYMGRLDLLGMQSYLAMAPSSFQPQLNRLKI